MSETALYWTIRLTALVVVTLWSVKYHAPTPEEVEYYLGERTCPCGDQFTPGSNGASENECWMCTDANTVAYHRQKEE
jgi:hypothetical protein